MTWTLSLLLLCTIVLAAAPASAQAPPIPRLPPAVVEGARVPPERTATEKEAREEIERQPGAVNIIGQDQIREGRAANLKDVLDFTPGVLIRPRFGSDESQISIRGSGLRNNFHLRGLNILIDGFPYGNADGFSDFEALELLTTKRIEVYRGASALRFGGNTLGGAINLVTKTGYDAGLFEIRTEGGSFGFFKGYVGTGQVYGPFDLYVGLTDTELEGFRDHAEQIRRRAYGTVGYRLPGGTTLRFDLGFTASNERLPGALTRQELDRDPSKANPNSVAFREARNYDYTRGAFTVRTPLTENQTLEWATQLNYQDLDHPLSFAIIDDTTYSWSSELRWILSAPLAGHGNRLTVGLQYFGTRQNDAQFVNNLGNRGDADRGPHQRRQQLRGLRRRAIRSAAGAHTRRRRPHPVRGARRARSVRHQRHRPGGLHVPVAEGGRHLEGLAGGPGVCERLPRLRAPAAARADRARSDPGQSRPAGRPEGLAVRDRHPGRVGAARDVGCRRVRHRAVGRDPERQRRAIRRCAVHDPTLPEHRPLSAHRRRGRCGPAPRRGPRPAASAWERRETASGRGRPTHGRDSSSSTT